MKKKSISMKKIKIVVGKLSGQISKFCFSAKRAEKPAN